MSNLSASALLEQNLRALKNTNPELAASLAIDDGQGCLLRLEEGRRGQATLKAVDQQGEFYLHSPYDPVRESEQLIERDLPELQELDVVIILGFGLGYLPEAVLARLQPEQRLVIVEPDPCVLRLAAATRPMAELFADERLIWSVGTDIETTLGRIIAQLDRHTLSGWKVLLPPAIARCYLDFSRDFVLQLGSMMNTLQARMATAMIASELIMRNALSNLRYSHASPGVNDFRGRWQNRPVVLVSAGPSLDKQLPLLRQYRQRILIIAVGQAWRSLRAAGIEPHIVVTVDPHPANYNHFEGLRSEGAWLLADGSTNTDVVSHFDGKRIFAYPLEEVEKLFAELQGARGCLPSGGSVANTAFSFALMLKASPIILVGQDLAFTGGLTHAKENVYRQSIDDLPPERRHNMREVPGYDGSPVITNSQMDVYRFWFERVIAQLGGVQVINATEGGARIAGVNQQRLADALSTYCGDELIAPAELWPDDFSAVSESDLNKALKGMMARLRDLEKVCLEGVAVSRRLQKAGLDKADLKRQIRKLNTVEKDYLACKESARVLLNAFLAKETYCATHISEKTEGGVQQHARVAEAMYSHIIAACKRASMYLRDAQLA
ncbi:MAG: DUF115 domain-containing protein [Chromatiales bacterium]|nr:DUF115 domain-containing protein [Chromatiales bacterium]